MLKHSGEKLNPLRTELGKLLERLPQAVGFGCGSELFMLATEDGRNGSRPGLGIKIIDVKNNA